jgi:hypothetical protein
MPSSNESGCESETPSHPSAARRSWVLRGASSPASRRKPGSVALRPRLWPGVRLSRRRRRGYDTTPYLGCQRMRRGPRALRRPPAGLGEPDPGAVQRARTRRLGGAGSGLSWLDAGRVELGLRSIANAVRLDDQRAQSFGFAGVIRGARLGAPPHESAEYLDGWDAAIACVAGRLFGEDSPEVKALETLPPSRWPPGCHSLRPTEGGCETSLFGLQDLQRQPHARLAPEAPGRRPPAQTVQVVDHVRPITARSCARKRRFIYSGEASTGRRLPPACFKLRG